MNNNEFNSLHDAIKKFKIKQLYVSGCLNQFQNRFYKKFPTMKKYYKSKNNKTNTLFFGLYNLFDLQIVNNQDSYIFIMFGGTDVDLNLYLKIHKSKLKHVVFICISEDIYNRVKHLGKVFIIKNFTLLEPEYFEPIKEYGCNIYVYDGFRFKRDVYNLELIDKIKVIEKENFDVLFL